ncbi:MAG: hypothetical protein N2C14_01620 [Planctomycetales bacterium]
MVAAPLYHEEIFLIARDDVENLRDLNQLPQLVVSLGAEKSGNRRVALQLLEYFEFDLGRIREPRGGFRDFHAAGLDLAIVVTRGSNRHVQALLKSSGVGLLPIPRRDVETLVERHPFLRSHELTNQVVPGAGLPEENGISALRIPTVLTVRPSAPPVLVQAVLDMLHGDVGFAKEHGLLSRDAAAGWGGWEMHETAERFLETP